MTDPESEYTAEELNSGKATPEALEAWEALHGWGARVFERAFIEHLTRESQSEVEEND